MNSTISNLGPGVRSEPTNDFRDYPDDVLETLGASLRSWFRGVRPSIRALRARGGFLPGGVGGGSDTLYSCRIAVASGPWKRASIAVEGDVIRLRCVRIKRSIQNLRPRPYAALSQHHDGWPCSAQRPRFAFRRAVGTTSLLSLKTGTEGIFSECE